MIVLDVLHSLLAWYSTAIQRCDLWRTQYHPGLRIPHLHLMLQAAQLGDTLMQLGYFGPRLLHDPLGLFVKRVNGLRRNINVWYGHLDLVGADNDEFPPVVW